MSSHRKILTAQILYLEDRIAQQPIYVHPQLSHHDLAPRHMGHTTSGKRIGFHHNHPGHSNFSHMDHLEAHGRHNSAMQHHGEMARKLTQTGQAQRAQKHQLYHDHHKQQAMHHWNSANALHKKMHPLGLGVRKPNTI